MDEAGSGPFGTERTWVRALRFTVFEIVVLLSISFLGTSFDHSLAFADWPNTKTDARILGEVIAVECEGHYPEFDAYIATIKVLKVFHGKVKSPVKLTFSVYKKDETRFGASNSSFLLGETDELQLTSYEGRWAVQFPFHKKTVRPSKVALQSCKN